MPPTSTTPEAPHSSDVDLSQAPEATSEKPTITGAELAAQEVLDKAKEEAKVIVDEPTTNMLQKPTGNIDLPGLDSTVQVVQSDAPQKLGEASVWPGTEDMAASAPDALALAQDAAKLSQAPQPQPQVPDIDTTGAAGM